MSSNQPAPREITVTYTINAPRELVFEAFTDAKHVAQWWGPQHFTNPICEIDARPGGKMNIHMMAPDGEVYPAKGTFREVVRPERIVFADGAFEDADGNPMLEVVNTVTFEERDGKTVITLHALVLKATPEVEEPLAGMEQGWTESLDKLTEYLKTIA